MRRRKNGRLDKMAEKKRHHYIPIVYLKAFSDETGKVLAYRKDEPQKSIHARPDEIAFEKYYYSQPLPNDSQDNAKLEDLFGTIETLWPEVLEHFRKREKSTQEKLLAFF